MASRMPVSTHIEKLDALGYQLIDSFVDRTSIPVNLKHIACGHIWPVRLDNIYHGKGCPRCAAKMTADRQRIPTEKHREDIAKLGYELMCDYVPGVKAPIPVKHVACGHVWPVRLINLYRDHGCPRCKESNGEKMIARILDRLKIRYNREHADHNNETGYGFEWDFYVRDYHAIIEFHGKQHFLRLSHFHKTDQDLLDLQEKDRIRVEYARSIGCRYLMIPYTITQEDQAEQMIRDFLAL